MFRIFCLQLGVRLENIDDIVISLLKSSSKDDSADNWKGKLLHIFQDVASEVFSDFLNSTSSSGESTQHRPKRSLEMADLMAMMDNMKRMHEDEI